MRVSAVVQARAGSERMPGKVLRPLRGRPVLGWVIRAAMSARGVDDVIVATSDRAADDDVAAVASECGAQVIRGSESDVLSRFVAAIEAFPCDAVVRLTGDCPLLDAELIDAVVAMWRAAPTTDYVSTTLVRTLPRGLDVELVRSEVLRQVAATATGHHRAHVTSAVHGSTSQFRLAGLVVAPPADDLRVTLDTPDDERALAAMVAELGDRVPHWWEIVALLRSRPDIVSLNAHVVQKALEEG